MVICIFVRQRALSVADLWGLLSPAGMISLWWARQWRMAVLPPPTTTWCTTPASWNPTTCSASPTSCATCTTTGRWVPGLQGGQRGSGTPCSSKGPARMPWHPQQFGNCRGYSYLISLEVTADSVLPSRYLLWLLFPIVTSKMEVISYLQK